MVDSSSPLIFDISSGDEDEANLLANIGTVDSDCDWISELFPDDERETERKDENSDSDEVVVISEILANTKKKKKEDGDDDVDDDCVVLEEDPDKRVKVESDGGIDTDDLVIVGEKGEIACRDYPHARHLCAKFLFATTTHEHHCNQCHCYVCDSLAPCLYWGNGSSNTDHCHSTDQDPLWKAQRQNFKQGNKAPSPLLQPTDATLLLPPPQTIPFPISTPAQNQIVRLPAIHSYSTPNSGISNVTHQQKSHPSLNTSPIDKFNPSLVSQQLIRSCNTNNTNHIVGRQTRCNLEAQHLNRPRIFKRSGSNSVATPNSRPGYGTTNKYASQYPRNPHTSAKLSNQSSSYQQKQSVTGSHSQQNYSGSSRGSVPPSQAHVNGSNTFVNSVPCQPQAFNQFESGNSFENSVTSQQYSLQTNMGSTFVNPMPPPSQAIPQPNMDCFQNQFPLESYSHPNMGINNFENAVPCQSQAISQPNTGSGVINPIYSQSRTYNLPNYSQQGNETRSAMNPSSADQYSRIDSFPAQDPALSRQPAVSEYGSSIAPENTNSKYSYYSRNDPWI